MGSLILKSVFKKHVPAALGVAGDRSSRSGLTTSAPVRCSASFVLVLAYDDCAAECDMAAARGDSSHSRSPLCCCLSCPLVIDDKSS